MDKKEKIVIMSVIAILLGIISIMGFILNIDYITRGEQWASASGTPIINLMHRALLFAFSFIAIGIGMVNISLKKYGRLAVIGLISGIIAILIFITMGF